MSRFSPRRGRRSGLAGAGVAVVVALVAAEGAVVLLRPRTGVVAPLPVRVESYFSHAELDRARSFRRPQLALSLATALVQLAVLAVLVRRPPRPRGLLRRRPLLAAAAAGAGISVALTVATLPLSAAATQRARDVGLVTQSWAGWIGDVGKTAAISVVLAGAGTGFAAWLMRRAPRRWWIAGSGVVVVVGAGFLFAGPVLLDPLFNRFTPLPAGRTRSDVLELARQAGVRVGEVYEVDASRRTTAANAYVSGLGSTKRVVLYDTLVRHFTRDETRLVVAHELGHVHYADVPRGLLYLALVAPAAMFAVATVTRRLAPAGEEAGVSTVPALLLAIALVSAPVGWISNGLSRRVEARADSYSLALTGAAEPFISFERGITLRNVGDPDPPWLLEALFGTHPSTVQRIGIAKAFEKGARPQ